MYFSQLGVVSAAMVNLCGSRIPLGFSKPKGNTSVFPSSFSVTPFPSGQCPSDIFWPAKQRLKSAGKQKQKNKKTSHQPILLTNLTPHLSQMVTQAISFTLSSFTVWTKEETQKIHLVSKPYLFLVLFGGWNCSTMHLSPPRKKIAQFQEIQKQPRGSPASLAAFPCSVCRVHPCLLSVERDESVLACLGF